MRRFGDPVKIRAAAAFSPQPQRNCCTRTFPLQVLAQQYTQIKSAYEISLPEAPCPSAPSRPRLPAPTAASCSAPADKPAARANVIAAISGIDWGSKTLSVRINALDTPFWYRDVVDLIEQGGTRLDRLMIPKVGCAEDVYAVDALVTAVEAAMGRQKKLQFEVIIESAAGISHVDAIAAASPRLVAISLGAADFAASMGMQTTGIGGTQDNYYMLKDGARHYPDPWHWAQTAIVAACRTHGLLPVDGPFGDFSDDDGFLAQARRSATLGMVGKWAIHPRQIALANRVFTPSPEQLAEAREILAAMRAAESAGQGATTYKGRLVDLASIRQAQVIVAQAALVEAL